jgi:hypothetical protein
VRTRSGEYCRQGLGGAVQTRSGGAVQTRSRGSSAVKVLEEQCRQTKSWEQCRQGIGGAVQTRSRRSSADKVWGAVQTRSGWSSAGKSRGSRLIRCRGNTIHNVDKFSGSRGTVLIRCRRSYADSVRITGRCERSSVFLLNMFIVF